MTKGVSGDAFGKGFLACRYELKYRIGEAEAEAIKQFIKPYLRPDSYCESHFNGAYPIVSLYFDSDNLQLCRESMTGKKNRFKLRIRSYSDDPNYPRFLEIKRRVNTVILKDRHAVTHRDVRTLLSNRLISPSSYTNDGEVLRQFQWYMDSINARALMHVRYVRQAYEDGSHNRVRITFDRNLCFRAGYATNVSLDGQGWRHCALDGVILEIKYTAHYPAWLSEMVKCFNLQQQSVSKYVSSVRQSYVLGFCAPQLLV